jgi:hypothetical protein
MKRFLLIAIALLSLKAYAQESPSSDTTFTIHRLICADPANIINDIPQEIEYITVYTQYRKPKSTVEKVYFGESYLCPYVIRFEDSTSLSILQKQMKKVVKRLRKVPVDIIEFSGFELERIGNMQDDVAAQRASSTDESYGLHDYGKRGTPVYYFKRVH